MLSVLWIVKHPRLPSVQPADGQPETDWAADFHADILIHLRRRCLVCMKKRRTALCNEGLTGSSCTNIEAFISSVCLFSSRWHSDITEGPSRTLTRCWTSAVTLTGVGRWWRGESQEEKILLPPEDATNHQDRIITKDGCFLPHPDLLSFVCVLKFFHWFVIFTTKSPEWNVGIVRPCKPQICCNLTCHFELYMSWQRFWLSTKAFGHDQEHIMFQLEIPGNVLMPSTNV